IYWKMGRTGVQSCPTDRSGGGGIADRQYAGCYGTGSMGPAESLWRESVLYVVGVPYQLWPAGIPPVAGERHWVGGPVTGVQSAAPAGAVQRICRSHGSPTTIQIRPGSDN